MDNSIEYKPLTWHWDEGHFFLVRHGVHGVHKVYGPFDATEAVQAGEVWGVPFIPEQPA